MPRNKKNPQRLYPEPPPKRLQDDPAWRKNASLSRLLRHQPGRLLTTKAPSRLLPRRVRLELLYRLTATVTSFALLLSLLGTAIPVLFVPAARADAVEDSSAINYDWLDQGRTGTQASPYQIGTAAQLLGLSMLVQDIQAVGDSKDVLVNNVTRKVVGVATVTNGPLAAPPAPTEDIPAPTLTPIPVETPIAVPTATPVAAPETTPAPADTAPAEEPVELTPEPIPLAALPEEPLPAPTEEPLPGPTSEPTPEPTPAPTETPEATPVPSDTPAPTETPTPTETPLPIETPVPTETPLPVETPIPTETALPTEAPIPSEPPAVTPSPPPAFNGGLTLTTGNIQIPVGFLGCYIELTADLDLTNYSGGSGLGVGALSYWTPIGILSGITASADGKLALAGTPFQGTFNGKGNSVTSFSYAPDYRRIAPTGTPDMAGYGLFGYVGASGTVENLTVRTAVKNGNGIPWVLDTAKTLDDSNPELPEIVTVDLPLGVRAYSVGVVAGAVEGTISGCTVTQVDMRYTTKPTNNDLAPTAIGGLAGIAADTAKLIDCTVLGKMKSTLAPGGNGGNTGAARQAIGGIAGYLAGAGTVTLERCAAGVDMDIFNGTAVGKNGGVGGLFGYASAPLDLKSSFSTGVVLACHDAGGLGGKTGAKATVTDSFSTAAIGFSTALSAADSAKLAITSTEAIGGLLGANNAWGSSLSRTYFAGSLLQSQFGAVAGHLAQGLSGTVAVDATQAPHGPAKHGSGGGLTVSADLSGFQTAGGWTVSSGLQPQLSWAVGSANATVVNLSVHAATQWATADSSNAVADNGRYSLYQLKDGNVGATLGGLTTRQTTYFDLDGTTAIGGVYTASVTIADTAVPAARRAISAVHQSAASANLIDSGGTFLRFAARVNLAGGGYLGSTFTIANAAIDAAGETLPAYPRSSVQPFCGTLIGGTGSVIHHFSYGSGASGLIDTAYGATLKNFTLETLSVGDVPLGTSSGYFGMLAGQVSYTDIDNVDVRGFSYTYNQSSDPANVYQGKSVALGLVGLLSGSSDNRTIQNCSVTKVAVNMTGGSKDFKVNFGGILGQNNTTASYTIKNCTVSGDLLIDFGDSSSSITDAAPHAGGIVAYDNSANGAIIENCYVTANLRAGRVGGIIGRCKALTLNQCVFSGSVASSLNAAATVTSYESAASSGGLIGLQYHYASVSINRCAVLGSVSSLYHSGGLIGYYRGGGLTVNDTYGSAVVRNTASGVGASGGLVGYLQSSGSATFTSSYFSGQVSAVSGVSGSLVGQTDAVVTSLNFPNTLFDNSLTQKNAPTVGKTALTGIPDRGVRPADAKWATLAGSSAAWSNTDPAHRYPQLVWTATTAVSDLCDLSTRHLFDVTDLSTVYSVGLGQMFRTILPTGRISGRADLNAPFAEAADVPPVTGGGFTTTSYLVSDTGEGIMHITYMGAGPNGGDLTVPYTIGVKPFEYGEGVADDPYIIYNLRELQAFRAFVNSTQNTSEVYYQVSTPRNESGDYLPTRIEMTDVDWQHPTSALAGHLDGFGSTLTDFYTTGSTDSKTGVWSAGLLSGLASGSTVKNLTIEGDTVKGAISGPMNLGTQAHAAGILSAQTNGGTITGVTTQGTITVDRDVTVGGLVGRASITDDLTLFGITTDVTITGGENGTNSAGSGGIVGAVSTSGSAIKSVSLSQCATYGTQEDWGCVGGLLGQVNNSALRLGITDCLSLTTFFDSNKSTSSYSGGLVGSIENVYSPRTDKNGAPIDHTHTVIANSYYAGENRLNGNGSYTVGGIVGAARAVTSYLESQDPNNPNNWDYTNLTIKYSPYNSSNNQSQPANLYRSGGFQGAYGWPDNPDSSINYGTNYYDNDGGTSFTMSQGTDSRDAHMDLWSTGVWQFDDGLYPRLKRQDLNDGALTFNHLAIHYTKAQGTGHYANVFVRYAGATLSAGSPFLRVTENRRMALATASDPDAASATITITINNASRSVTIVPSVESTGYRDVSIYYANPGGMWPTTDGAKVWTAYTADALAGLSTIFSSDTEDQNRLPELKSTALAGGQVWLGRDINLGAAYTGMTEYTTWRSIGDDTHPFNITLDGKGRTLYNLGMNPFYQMFDYYDDTNSYTDRAVPLGLFGVIDGGTVRNLALVGSAPASQSPYLQPGLRVGMGTTVAGTLAATVKSGALENCLVSLPIYTLGAAPKATDKVEIWDAVTHLGANSTTPLGGLVGQVTGDATIRNCAYTGYVYADAKNKRVDASAEVPKGTTAGPVGGLVGLVASGGTLAVEHSYAAGYVKGGDVGALVGQVDGGLTLTGASFDRNASGSGIDAVGSGTAAGDAPRTEVPDDMGTVGWQSSAAGLYPLPSALTASADTLAARIRVALNPHASSTTSGSLSYTQDNAELFNSKLLQPGLAAAPGEVEVKNGRTFTKMVDGPTQLELRSDGTARRVLIELRCWYNDVTVDDLGVKHYTISTAEELWELGQIVNGTIHSAALSKVGHTHDLADGFDDFNGDILHLEGDVDLTALTDIDGGGTAQPRPWIPIGHTHPFAGSFQGGGHSVRGMTVDSTLTSQGLFGTVSGAIADLLLSSAVITLPTGGSEAVGGLLCAELTGTGKLDHCGTSGVATAHGATPFLGGLVGRGAGTITGCFSTAELYQASASTQGYLGGLVGRNSGSTALITKSYFTGFVSATNTAVVGGIAGDNMAGGRVSECYTSAYLNGNQVYTAAKDAERCVYDGRHTARGDGGTRQDGAALVVPGAGWTSRAGYYPVPSHYYAAATANTPLAAAAQTAAGIFTFGGTTNPNYARFHTVQVASAVRERFLRSDESSLLAVSGSEARTVGDRSGDVILRLCLGTTEQVDFQRPCWLSIPSALAVTYRFNWDDLIDESKRNPDYRLTAPSAGTWSAAENPHIISTVSDWTAFTSYVNGGGTTAGHTFVLDYDLDFGNVVVPTVTAPFYGAFHGGNRTMSNLQLRAPLFASVEKGARVEMLALRAGNVTVTGSGTLTSALVAGVNRGRIANVAAEQFVVSGVQNSSSATHLTTVGGLVGENLGTLDSCYFLGVGGSGESQVRVNYPADTVPNLRMGGLAGYNAGMITGNYATVVLQCTIGGIFDGNHKYYSTLVGLNDGGAILYTYWNAPTAIDTGTILVSSYRNSDGTAVGGVRLFMGNTPTELTARWLSADSYGGTYYLVGDQLKLYCFRLARYDLSQVFGDYANQYLMLGLQFDSEGSGTLFSNAVCSWKNYLLPNFANLPLTSTLSVRLPLLSSNLTYSVTHAYVIRKDTSDRGEMGGATVTGSHSIGYSVTNLGADPTRVFLDIGLTPMAEQDAPWGVFRSDSTLPQPAPTP